MQGKILIVDDSSFSRKLVTKALEEYGVYPTHISGTSIGAIVGALYAYGYNWDEILLFFKKVDPLDLKKYARNKPGFIATENVGNKDAWEHFCLNIDTSLFFYSYHYLL